MDEIDFDWIPTDARTALWEKGFTALTNFKKREGHCNVAYTHMEGDHKLGIWVYNQRKNKDKQSPERRQQLDEIGFDWGEKGPDNMLQDLIKFVKAIFFIT